MALLLKGLWICSFLSSVLCSVDVQLTAKPSTIEARLTSALTLSCVASVNNTDPTGNNTAPNDMSYVSAMIMTHDGNDVASVSGFPHAGPAEVFEAYKASIEMATGAIDATGQSTLTVTLLSPLNTNDTGNYSCKAVGGNDQYQPSTESASVVVFSHTPDTDTVLGEVVVLQRRLENLTMKVERMEKRWQHVDELPLFRRLTPTPAQAASTDGSSYLLSRDTLGHAHLAQFVCFVQGGYLAEVNTQAERETIQKLLSGESSDEDIWVGTSNLHTAGQWQHMYHVNATMSLSGSVAGGGHCTMLTRRSGYMEEARDCQSEGRALCEMPGDL